MEINENISNIVHKIAVDASKRNEKISTITIGNMFLNNMFSSQVDRKSFANEVLKYNIVLVQILNKVTTGEITVNELKNYSNNTSNNPINQLETLFPGITNLIIDKKNGISFKKEFEETFTPFLDNPTTSMEQTIVDLLNKNKNYFKYLTNIYLDHNFGQNRKVVNKKLFQKHSHIHQNNNLQQKKPTLNVNPSEVIPYIIQSEINKKTPKIESMIFQLCSTFMRIKFIKQDPNYSSFAQDLKTTDFLNEILTSVKEMMEEKTLTSNNISYYNCKQIILNSSINGSFKPELAINYLKSNISILVPIIHDYLEKKYNYSQPIPAKRQEDPTLRPTKRNSFFSDTLKQKIKDQIENNPFTTQQEIINKYINNNFDYNILNVHKDEFFSIIIKDYIINSIEEKNDDVFLNIKTIAPLFDENINCLTYIENNPVLLNLLISEYYNNNFGVKIKQDIKLTNHEKNIVNMLLSKVDYDKDVRKKFPNTKINHQSINKCREDIINGSQFNHNRRSYSYDNMYATTDIGKFRSNQEDSVIITTHPKQPECKLIIVADGVGGHNNGELASLQVTRNMLKWFEGLTPTDLADTPKNLQEKYITAIKKTNTIICQDPNIQNGGSTFAGALVTSQNTIIANVGDSRGYIYINGELKQITTDHSHAQILYEKNIIKNKDDIRFHKDSNVITQMLGESPVRISSKIIPNDYDKLILLSDGVTDCLSDEQIKIITKNKPIEILSDSIVDTALNTNSKKPTYLDNKNYRTQINGGKDNTTAAVLDNTTKRR